MLARTTGRTTDRTASRRVYRSGRAHLHRPLLGRPSGCSSPFPPPPTLLLSPSRRAPAGFDLNRRITTKHE
jgi:hypothetical protein